MTTIIILGTYYILCADELVVRENVHMKLHFSTLLWNWNFNLLLIFLITAYCFLDPLYPEKRR